MAAEWWWDMLCPVLMRRLIFIAGMVLGSASLAEAPPAPFSAGLRTIEAVDRGTGEPMPIRVWYPAHEQEVRREIEGLPVHAAFDAPLAPGTFGLVAISHGTGGSVLEHRNTATAIARHGWIAAAPLHPRNHSADNSGAGSRSVWLRRPQQMREAIDLVLADPEFGPAIDPSCIGALGFSAGGYTVLALIGSEPDLRHAAAHCRAHRDEDAACRGGTFCTKLRTVLGVAREALFGRSEAWARLQDPRVRAAVVMAPVGIVFDENSFANVRAPVRLYRAEADEQLSVPFHAERVRSALPTEPEYVVVEAAPHTAFVAPIPEGRPGGAGVQALEPSGFDHAAFHEQLNAEVVDFFNRTLGNAPGRDGAPSGDR